MGKEYIKSINVHVDASTPDNRDVQSSALEIKEGEEFDRGKEEFMENNIEAVSKDMGGDILVTNRQISVPGVDGNKGPIGS
ncbi:hypothetical protein LguiB_021501 [Lonicera macranthoides]